MNIKKILSMIIAVLLVFSSVSMSSFAADYTAATQEIVATNDEVIASDDEVAATKDEALATEDEIVATDDEASDITPEASPDENPMRLLGDTDNNSVVNVKDATLIRKFIADLSTLDEISQIYADVDRNETVNIKDATVIQKYVADIDIKESVGYPYDAAPETYRYYFYLPEDWLNESTAQTGNTAGIYWWEGTGYHDGWPGVPAMKGDVDGVYYYDVPTDVLTIIWNNYFHGGIDSSAPYYNDVHMTIEIGTEFYYPGESDFYPEGLKNFDGMIYVVDPTMLPVNAVITRPAGIGEWFYYYGNGEYGTSPIRGESKILTGDTFDHSSLLLDNNPPNTYRYFFYMPPEWLNDSTATTGNTAGIYWWEGTGAQARYPGRKAVATEVEGVYYCDVPTDVPSIIWNNFFDGGDDPMTIYYADALSTRDVDVDGYDPGQSKNYPEGLETFDGMIFVTDFIDYDYDSFSGRLHFGGEWFYYYGNGEYGTAPQRGESEILTDYAQNIGHFISDSDPYTY